MTTSNRHGDPDAVFDRDEHTCRRCGTTADEDPQGLALYPVGDVSETGTVHESSLVTVCSPCFSSLRSTPDADVVLDGDELFDLVRETTERQGVTVSAVAAFASLATELPHDLEAAVSSDESASPDSSDAVADEYVQARREVLLAIDSVDSRLDRFHALDDSTLEDVVADAVVAFTGAGTKLQSELRGIVALGEGVAASLERCHGCFEALEDDVDSCPTCDLGRRDVSDWAGEDGVEFHRLFNAINDTLLAASETTKTLTTKTTAVAEQLRG
ncbi:HNH endonuclease [Natrarchaeobius chitinivorans]|uniref:HNH endonuclease n=1 Tax=Natrarchaeobius chitinivorans TaxID=1679083 RepID=A0A3N6M9Z5_NATCH|nr:HNH endonuclease [Natrarchaeobius chitinivorans]RQG92231.1 HNH endonuclease [Natrarchaeobius chitinivorans]